MKSACCKNRNDIAGRSIDIERHVCPGDTSVQLLHQLQELMSETSHAPGSFQDTIIFASMVNDHQLGKSGGAKHMPSSSERSGWLLTQQDADLAIFVSVVQDQKTLGKKGNDHLTSSQTVNGAISL